MMNRTALTIGISLAAGFAAAAIVFTANRPAAEPAPEPGFAAGSEAYFDQSAATEDRIRALEDAVAQERNARLLLEEELQALYTAIDELGGSEEARRDDDGPEGRANSEDVQAFRQRRSAETSDVRRGRLIDAGFSPDQAEWILQRESELQMQQLQAIYEARQSGERPDRSLLDPDGALRQELGDDQYEQYLEAYGRPTSVAVTNVLGSSPGQRAGLQQGDEIVAYGGDRVFNNSDLHRAAMTRESGQSVVVDVVRDGVPIQIVVDSGPIGISMRESFAIPIRR